MNNDKQTHTLAEKLGNTMKKFDLFSLNILERLFNNDVNQKSALAGTITFVLIILSVLVSLNSGIEVY